MVEATIGNITFVVLHGSGSEDWGGVAVCEHLSVDKKNGATVFPDVEKLMEVSNVDGLLGSCGTVLCEVEVSLEFDSGKFSGGVRGNILQIHKMVGVNSQI